MRIRKREEGDHGPGHGVYCKVENLHVAYFSRAGVAASKTDRSGGRLPYFHELVFMSRLPRTPEVLRFESGDRDMISQLGQENFSVSSRQRRGYAMTDARLRRELDKRGFR
jgi:hypothetical protein